MLNQHSGAELLGHVATASQPDFIIVFRCSSCLCYCSTLNAIIPEQLLGAHSNIGAHYW